MTVTRVRRRLGPGFSVAFLEVIFFADVTAAQSRFDQLFGLDDETWAVPMTATIGPLTKFTIAFPVRDSGARHVPVPGALLNVGPLRVPELTIFKSVVWVPVCSK